MAVQSFSDLYLGECGHCGADLENWEWSEDDMLFRTACTCGIEVTLEPTNGLVEYETIIVSDEDAEEEDA